MFPGAALYEIFQSTSSVWRTTSSDLDPESNKNISIHVLRVEDDKARFHGPKGH